MWWLDPGKEVLNVVRGLLSFAQHVASYQITTYE